MCPAAWHVGAECKSISIYLGDYRRRLALDLVVACRGEAEAKCAASARRRISGPILASLSLAPPPLSSRPFARTGIKSGSR